MKGFALSPDETLSTALTCLRTAKSGTRCTNNNEDNLLTAAYEAFSGKIRAQGTAQSQQTRYLHEGQGWSDQRRWWRRLLLLLAVIPKRRGYGCPRTVRKK